MKNLVVIAIGGNSLIKDPQHMTVFDQYKACGETSEHIAGVIEQGYRVLITHGNGPQVGFILLRSEMARQVLHEVPLDSCGADTQGAIGYQISQTLENELRRRGIDRTVVAVVTQTVVDRDDPGFQNPTKPIGPFYPEAAAKAHQQQEGWIMREDAGRGWRRLVASPEPLEIIEEPAIRVLLEDDIIVVAAGGGGIPVIRREDDCLEGVGAVIDKDLTSALLANNLGAEKLLISTAVDMVALDFGKPTEREIDRMTIAQANEYLAQGQFAVGSMKPKIEAAVDFLERGGQEVVITKPPCSARPALTSCPEGSCRAGHCGRAGVGSGSAPRPDRGRPVVECRRRQTEERSRRGRGEGRATGLDRRSQEPGGKGFTVEYKPKREAVRVQKPIEVTYTADCPPIQGRIEDISEKGFFLDTTHPLAVGSIIQYRFLLPGPSPETPIEGEGRVVWAEPMVGVGIEFVGMSQEDRDRIRFFVASVYFGQEGQV
jgi:carbamate kinase